MIRDKVDKIPNDILQTTHWMAEALDRRLSSYNADNLIDNFKLALVDGSIKFPMERFFQENKTEVFEVDCDGQEFEMFESMRIYIERNGRPYNYLSSVDELNVKRHEHLTVEEQDWKEQLKNEREEKDGQVFKEMQNLESLADRRIAEIHKHMQDLG